MSPQTHTMDVALAALAHTRCRDDTLHTHWQVYDLRTSCTDTNTCTRNSSSKYGGIPGRAALTWLIGSCFLGCGCSGDIQSAIRVGNSRGKGRELEPDSGQCRAVQAQLGLGPGVSSLVPALQNGITRGVLSLMFFRTPALSHNASPSSTPTLAMQ